MHDASKSLLECSRALVQGILHGKEFDGYYYDCVLKLFEVESTRPVVFWNKWTSTYGHMRSASDPTAFDLVRPEEVGGMHVVLIDCLRTFNTYLDGGIARAKENGATRIDVLTPRVQFGEEDLDILASHVDRIFLTHKFLFGMDMLEKLMPGRVKLVPSSPDLLPRKLELADRIFWEK